MVKGFEEIVVVFRTWFLRSALKAGLRVRVKDGATEIERTGLGSTPSNEDLNGLVTGVQDPKTRALLNAELNKNRSFLYQA